MLQGDTWSGLPVRNDSTGEVKNVIAVVLSNSCSIDPANDRVTPPRVVFAPLVDLGRYEQMLLQNFSQQQVQAKLDAIREQRVNNVFYLPAGANLKADHIALLDNLHSCPAPLLTDPEIRKGQKASTLAMAGFYLFLFKLSVHFCRFSEKVQRNRPTAA